MATGLFWSNVGVDVQTALSSAITITAISKANPAVVSYSGGTDPSNGDYIVLSVNGMHQANDRILRVANVNAAGNTLELEGVDATGYDTFSSGSFQIVTFGASMTTVQGINVSGGDPEFSDITTVHDNVRKRVPTVVSPLQFSMDCRYDLSDAAYLELNRAYQAKTTRAIRLRFANGYKMLLTGYVAAAGVPTGQAQGVVQTKVSIEAQNVPQVYAT